MSDKIRAISFEKAFCIVSGYCTACGVNPVKRRAYHTGVLPVFNMTEAETPGRVYAKALRSPQQNISRRQNQVATSEKIRIKLKSYDSALIDAAAEKFVDAAKRNGATVSGPIPLPTDREVITILRAVHKYKDSREQFEMRTHKRLIDVIKPSQKTIEALTSLELPAGVEVEIKL